MSGWMHWLVFVALLSTCTALTPAQVEDLRRDIGEAVRCRSTIPGLAVTVVQDGEIVLAEGFGRADLEKNVSVTNNTVFGIASLSKAFASTLLLKLIGRRDNITVDTKVKDIIPEFGFPDDDLRTDYTTLEDLLSHRTGLSSNNRIRFDTNLTRANIVSRIKQLAATGKWRGSYMYSNLMYGVVTRLGEMLGRASWEELVRREIYQPLQMDSSTFATLADFSADNIAKPYFVDGDQIKPLDPEFSRRWAMLCGSGCVMTSPLDAANWIRFHLSVGLGPTGERVMEEEDLEQAYYPRNPIPSPLKYFTQPDVPVSSIQHTYGLGWRLGTYRGNRMIVHTGTTFGYFAHLSLFPSENIGVFIVGTGYDPSFGFRTALQNYIMDTLLGVTPWLNVSTLCSFPEPWFDAHSPANYSRSNALSSDVDAYVGTYHNTPYGYLDVYYNDTEEQLMMKYGYGTFRLYLQEDETFRGSGTGMVDSVTVSSVTFRKKATSGTFSEVVVPGFDSRLPPVFLRGGPRREPEVTSQSPTGSGSRFKSSNLFLGITFLFGLCHGLSIF